MVRRPVGQSVAVSGTGPRAIGLIVNLAISVSVTALGNMLDLDLTSAGHSRSKQMPPNERPYMTSYPSLVISLAESTSVFRSKAMAPNDTSYGSGQGFWLFLTVEIINFFVSVYNQIAIEIISS